MLAFLRRIHTFLKARAAHHLRVKEVARSFRIAHAQELTITPLQSIPLVKARQALEMEQVLAGKAITDRKSWVYPYLPASIQRLSMPVAKTTPYSLRRFSRTPVARRAINLIKNSVIQQPWEIRAMRDAQTNDEDDQQRRIEIATSVFRHPNNTDSHQTWIEMGIEDTCVFGAFVSELTLTPDPERPLKMWVVTPESIRIFTSWSESTPDLPHYAQMTGLQGERGAILFYDDELMYIKDNPASDNPFGLGKLEVCFQSLNDLLGVQRMAGMAGADQVHKTWLWWEQPQSDAAYQIVRRHIQNELEGQAKISIIGGMKKPEVIEVQPVTEDDLLLNWQEMLIRMCANAFDMSAMALGIEHDVNRAVGEVLKDSDFRSAVVPMAKRLQESFTRKILHERLGWTDLEFVYLNLEDPDLETKNDMYSRMYSANALTPNEWRVGVGMAKMEDNPFSDLTQFQCMLLNMEAMNDLQNESAELAMQRQQTMMQTMQPQQPQEQETDESNLPPWLQQPKKPGQGGPQNQNQGGKPGGGGQQQQNGPITDLTKDTPGNIARGGQMQSPRPLALPKFPIAGSKWTAKQIAQMPLNELSDRINGGQLPKGKKLVAAMTQQEPGILDQLSEEVRQYLQNQIDLEDEKNEQKRQAHDEADNSEWADNLKKRVRKGNKRITDMTQYLQKTGRNMGRPGGMPYRGIKKPGKPGTPPPPRGI